MNRFYSVLYHLVWPFFNLVLPGKSIGREHVPEGGVVICSNHTGLSDPLYIAFALGGKTKLRIMAKAEMSKWPIVGWLLSKSGLIWVKRGQGDVGAIKAALKAIKAQEKLLIFPEGTRHDELGEGKTGAVMMAIRSNVPVMPVYVPAKKLWFRRTPIVFGEAYYPFAEDRRATQEDYRVATEELMARIAALGEGKV